MVVENVDKGDAKQNGTRGRQALSLFAGLVLALTIGAGKAKAQIVGDMVANVPFEFHAGNAEFPAGEYRIHSVDDSGLAVMQISTMDGSRSALFQVQESDASATPTKSELIFNKYGDQYFLSEVHGDYGATEWNFGVSKLEKRVRVEEASRASQQKTMVAMK